jgi:uncharacterized protein (TIGR04551 family)
VRTDFLHNLHLGQGYAMDSRLGADPRVKGLRPPPFPLPIECPAMQGPCSYRNSGGGNLRLRLEPTINVTDQVRVHSQIDVLDNTFMGSTPDSLVSATRPGDRSNKAPLGVLATTQDPPEFGRNGYLSSVRAKRAWGEVDTEFGSLSFGRMPWHFGRGMTFNSGGCQDCEGGTTVDRVMATTQIYGHQIALAWDWGAAGPHMGLTDLGRRDLEGAPLDLSQEDDVFELMASLTRYEDDRRFRERIDYGDVAVNYGLQMVYRHQNTEVEGVNDTPATTTTPTPGTMLTGGDRALTREQFAVTNGVNATVFLPSLWFKLGWKILTLEAEAGAVLGHHQQRRAAGLGSRLAAAEVAIVRLGAVDRAAPLSQRLLPGLRDRRGHRRSGRGPRLVPQLPLEGPGQAAGRRHPPERLQVQPRLPGRPDPLPPHPRHGHQRHLRQAQPHLLAGPGGDPPDRPLGGAALQPGPGAGVDARATRSATASS